MLGTVSLPHPLSVCPLDFLFLWSVQTRVVKNLFLKTEIALELSKLMRGQVRWSLISENPTRVASPTKGPMVVSAVRSALRGLASLRALSAQKDMHSQISPALTALERLVERNEPCDERSLWPETTGCIFMRSFYSLTRRNRLRAFRGDRFIENDHILVTRWGKGLH